MTPFTLLLRSLRYHTRGNLAMMLGVAVGTAVLVGALLVGDSLRGSLRERALQRLAGVEQVILLPRFVENPGRDNFVEPAVLLQGMVERDTPAGVRRAADVSVRGQAYLYQLYDPGSLWDRIDLQWNVGLRPGDIVQRDFMPDDETAYVSAALARELALNDGDTVRIRVPKFSPISRDSTFGRKTIDDLTQVVELKASIEGERSNVSRFSLAPGMGPVRAVFVPLPALQRKMNLGNKVNAVLASRGAASPPPALLGNKLGDFGLVVRSPKSRTADLFQLLDRDRSGTLEPREYRRRLADDTIARADTDGDKILSRSEVLDYFHRRGTVDLEAEGLLLSRSAEMAARNAADALAVNVAPTLVYLANSIDAGGASIPYSTIAAVDAQLPAPLGPYLTPAEVALQDDEILLVDWPESPLTVKPGDQVSVRYFRPESEGSAFEDTAPYRLRAKVPLSGVAVDPYLAPDFPGITDKLTLGEWDPPFPYDNKRIARRDDDYWDKYRSTPKAYVSTATGRRLFGSRFGIATSMRFATTDGQAVEKELLQKLDPADFQLTWSPVREKTLEAVGGGTDFGGLFLGFSMFLIVAALMLVGLLWKLNLESRAPEIGLLRATGMGPAMIRRLYLMEGTVVAFAGAALGLLLAIGYSALLLQLLAAMWPDGELAGLLQLHVAPGSLVGGMLGILAVTAGVILVSLRSLRRATIVGLLRGVIAPPAGLPTDPPSTAGRAAWVWVALLSGLVTAVGGQFVSGHEARAGAFFGAGSLFLTAGLLQFRRWLRAHDRGLVRPARSIAELGRRNVARHPGRSLLTAGLLAAAAFLLVSVESFRRQPAANFAEKSGGSGGYDFVATLDIPLNYDPGIAGPGRQELVDALERQYQKDPATKEQRLRDAAALLESSTLIPLRVHAGDDAGCRNLARPDRPRLIGLPNRFIDRGGFSVTVPDMSVNVTNPWSSLIHNPLGIVAFGEANTIQWSLKSGVGKRLLVVDSLNVTEPLFIAGTLQDSIFQGELLLSEQNFLKLFPDTTGYSMLVAASPPGRADELRQLLESAGADRGLATTRAIDRVAPYLAVENTYL
ncbi:MAG: FtsX-like permease family protein, partial [Gemmataceae bacterium]|nr:FtsX-like permease family protein [Gemmataceae bacterium]